MNTTRELWQTMRTHTFRLAAIWSAAGFALWSATEWKQDQ